MADTPILTDYHKYLLDKFQDPPGYVQTVPNVPRQAPPDQAQPLPQIYDSPPPDPKPEDPKRWTALDLALQGAFAGVSAYDAYDTNRFLRQNANGVEENPLFGKRPTAGQLAIGTGVGQAAHGLISNYLPHGWPRTAWQIATLLAEGSVVASNHGVAPFDKFWGWTMANGGADRRRTH